jgi:hypothetical protein
MFKILSHKRNVNQDYTKIPSHPHLMASRKQTTTNPGEDMGEKEPSYAADGNIKWCHHSGNHCGVSLKTKSRPTL